MAAQLGPWPVRATWALLPVTVGPSLGEALAEHSGSVARTGGLLAWSAWTVGLLAVAVPRAPGLTTLRILAPTLVAVVAWSAAGAGSGLVEVVALAWALATALVAFAPSIGEVFVDGSSYGEERRMLLRPPAALLLGPVPLAWAAAVAGPLAGPLLLAAGAWLGGGIVLAVGLPLAAVAIRALHGLSRRWVVFVPSGLVLHDLQALAEPVLFPRTAIARLGPALEDEADGALDLTLGALGLALQLDLREPLELAPRRGSGALEVVSVAGLRCTPSRPGALLAEASRRRIAVG